MGKVIKLEDHIYNRLEEIRNKRETFSQAVERIIKVVDGLDDIIRVLGGTRANEQSGRPSIERSSQDVSAGDR